MADPSTDTRTRSMTLALFKRPLIATDFTPAVRDEVRFARHLAASDAAFAAVHVVPPLPFLSQFGRQGREHVESLVAERLRAAEARVDEVVSDADLDAVVMTREGSVAAEVVHAAAAHDADVIVIGAGRHPMRERLGIGSNARAILRAADRPVLVVHGSREVRRIAVATDFFESSQGAARRARAIAEERGADLVVFHAVDVAAWSYAPAYEGTPTPVVDPAKVLQWSRQNLHEFNSEYMDGRAEEEIVEWDGMARIVGFLEKAKIDLVVLGTHGRGGFERVLLGSFAEALATRATCPVLVDRA